MMNEGSRQSLLERLRKASFEIIPINGIEERNHHLPAGSEVVAHGISALHFYTSDQLDSTGEWYRGMIEALENRSF